MPLPQRIFLIGLPGAGKTTLGRALATALDWPFLDLDEAIAAEVGQPIPDIFQLQGEAAFRQQEAATLRRVGLAAPLVLATGGGTPCFHDSMTWLLAHGHVLWLNLPPAVVAQRLLAPEAPPLAGRPLLAEAQATIPPESGSLQKRLEQTLTLRRPFYARAPHQSPSGTLDEVRALLGI